MEYIFTLIFQLPDQNMAGDALLEKLAQSGCDDALAGIGTPGKLALEFTREAPSAASAVKSALADVKRAVPQAQLREAAPDFVGLSDVAEIIGVSRQNMRKLMLSHSPQFPLPVHDGKTAIWHLADLLDWLVLRGSYTIPDATRDLAQITLQLNMQIAMQRYSHCMVTAAKPSNQ